MRTWLPQDRHANLTFYFRQKLKVIFQVGKHEALNISRDGVTQSPEERVCSPHAERARRGDPQGGPSRESGRLFPEGVWTRGQQRRKRRSQPPTGGTALAFSLISFFIFPFGNPFLLGITLLT